MSLRFHNQLTKKIEEFTPIKEGEVSLYTCGPTVYSYPTVGNWAAYIYWDVLVRTLTANNLKVTRVMNITDVGHLVSDADDGEDKLEKGAKREGKTAWDVANFYTDDFISGLDKLNIIKPDFIPRATEYIEEQLALVRKLKEQGATYQIDDGIYFDTSTFPKYPEFANLDLEFLKAGARVEYNAQKRNPSDFALWKFTPSGEKRDMEWDTPTDLLDEDTTRKGFPGWHLECSAMAMNILGEVIDIHTGGIDHIPVHHTNEIAQSEKATGKVFSNFWLHNNHLKVDGTKISKSLGNGYTLQDLEEKGYNLLDFKLMVLQSHYSKEGNFTFENLEAAAQRRLKWRNFASLRHQMHDTLVDDSDRNTDNQTVELYAASRYLIQTLSDNLNTADALSHIDDAFSKLESIKLNETHHHALISFIEVIDETLGIDIMGDSKDISDEQKQLIIARTRARESGDYSESDRIRSILLEEGIALNDRQKETIWQYTK